jgi:DNA polymerase II large subunit
MRPADDVAGRVEGLVGPVGVASRIRELSEEMTPHDVAFEIAHEIVESAKREGWNPEAVADQAIRTALAILTEGITAGPIEGIAQVKIKSNADGSRYLAVYFAGPIRAAGGTEAAQTVIVADAVRQGLDLDRYKPSPDIVERYVEEVALYNRVSHLQYPSNPEEVRLAARNLPVEVTGEPTAEVEVTGYRDLPGVETNRLRGGAILVLNDSILGKAHKLAKLVKEMDFEGWDWLERLVPRRQTDKVVEPRIQPRTKFLEEVIAGRPVLSYPSRRGGFRIRYGRSRNTGLAALGVHPATMVILDSFVACGTQLIIERPGKGCVAMPVDSIHGPIVKLRDGSIRRVDTVGEAKEIVHDVDRVLFLGDLLIGFGEFRENNHLLVPAGYCPEWWSKEVERALQKLDSPRRTALYQSIRPDQLARILKDPLRLDPSPHQALGISAALDVPLHPRYTYFWENLSVQQLLVLQAWLRDLSVRYEEDHVVELRGAVTPPVQAILEELSLPCEVQGTEVSFTEAAPILYEMFRGEKRCDAVEVREEFADALVALQKHWGIKLRPKGTFYIGARVGRPEKAKRREMSPPPHGIFPVGFAGGATRDILKAAEKSPISVEANLRVCPQCGRITMFNTCPDCATPTASVNWCAACRRMCKAVVCERCHGPTTSFGTVELPLKKDLKHIKEKLGGRLPARVKGVKGLSSKRKIPELLEKAVLRAKHNLFVYKDGTVRFDMTDAPLTHFKPSEVQTPPDKLAQLGYEADINGAPLTSDDQLLELRTQDIVIPKDCAQYLFEVSRFLDDLLTCVYGLEPFYQLSSPDDLVGHLVVGLAPHTSAGVIGRIIGFTPLRVCYAHPFWHAAKRRNCDGDEDAVMLALDPMINFSREYLPSSRGGTMDAPLVLSVTIAPKEIDDEAHNMDVSPTYPLEFYERTLQFADPRDVEEVFDLVAHRIGQDDRQATECQGFRFSHSTASINSGPRATTYTTLKTMQEKVDRQLALAKRIVAVDANDMAKRLLDSHFLPDVFGNIRAFSTQTVRCTGCNAKFRRVPLTGVCPNCSGKLVLTVTKAGITKYIDMARRIAEEYGVPTYHKQRLELASRIIDSLFASSKVDDLQTRLGTFEGPKGEGS